MSAVAAETLAAPQRAEDVLVLLCDAMVAHGETCTTAKVAVFDLVWVPLDATAGGPMTVGRKPDDGDT